MIQVKKILAAFLLLVFLFCTSVIQAQFSIFKEGNRVCFVGNSITHNGEFHHNILQYFVTRYPKEKIDFFNCGISGDITSGILNRMNDDILIHQPTHIVLMIGMNDVQRQLYTNESTNNIDTLTRRKNALITYRKNLDSIVNIFLKKGIQVILQKPSPYDQTSKLSKPNAFGVNDALKECSKIMQELADSYHLKTIDYWTIMTDITNELQTKNSLATLTVGDRVHPNSTGHLIMAYQFLKSTNASAFVSKLSVDVSDLKRNVEVNNCTIKSISNKKNLLQIKVLENALPFPTTENQQNALAIVPFNQEFNNQIVQVKNLSKANYQLTIDSTIIGTFSSEALQQGVNLSFYNNTPQFQQAISVRDQLNELWKIESNLRAIAYVNFQFLRLFNQKNDIVATKNFLDSIYNTRFKGQAWFATSFEKYIQYKPQIKKLQNQADSLRTIIYQLAQTKKHVFTFIKLQDTLSVAGLIEKSQSAAMPLQFSVQPEYLVNPIADFNSNKEFTARGGLPNFFQKIKQSQPQLTVAFLGGSITKAEDQYRNQTLAWLQTLNPKAVFQGINAGVSGTGTELGACRVKEQVLKYNPDLVFVEFAVNGGSNEALEGIVRQIIKANAQTDICFIYTIAGEQSKLYAASQLPAKIQAFEQVAAYYNLPSIHLGLYPAMLEQQKQLIWKSGEPIQDKIVFSKDGTHPSKAGGDLYAQAITRAFRFFALNTSDLKPHELLTPLYIDNWVDGGMYATTEIASFSEGWEHISLINENNLKPFAAWFSTVSKTTQPNAFCEFTFTGTAFGFFDIGGPEVGQILVEIDGKCINLTRKAGNAAVKQVDTNILPCLVNRFNANCNNRYRGQFELFEVPQGTHHIKLVLSSILADKISILKGQNLDDILQFPEKYKQQTFYLGKILINGNIHTIKNTL